MAFVIKNGPCGCEIAFKIIGTSWKPLIIDACNWLDYPAYSVIKSRCGEITDTELARQLKSLQSDGMIEKQTYKGITAYGMSQKGIDALGLMREMQHFAHQNDYRIESMRSSVEYTYRIIGTRWKARIIYSLHLYGTARFNELKRSVEGITHKVLSESLDALEERGIVNRIDYNEKSPRVEYSLTENGESAFLIVRHLADWCIKYGYIDPVVSSITV